MIDIKLLTSLGFKPSYKDGKEIYIYKKNGTDLETSPIENGKISVSGEIDILDMDSFYTEDKEELVELIIMIKDSFIELENTFDEEE